MLEHSKRPEFVRLRSNRTLVHELARNLVESKKKEMKDGVARADVMSLLGTLDVLSTWLGRLAHCQLAVRSSPSLRPDWRLTDDEIVYQVR